LLVSLRNSDTVVVNFKLHGVVLFAFQRHVDRRAGAKLDGVRNEIGDDLLERETITPSAQRLRRPQIQRRPIECRLGRIGLDDIPDDFGEVDRLELWIRPRGIHAPYIQQQRSTFHITIDDVLNAFQAARQGSRALLAGLLESR